MALQHIIQKFRAHITPKKTTSIQAPTSVSNSPSSPNRDYIHDPTKRNIQIDILNIILSYINPPLLAPFFIQNNINHAITFKYNPTIHNLVLINSHRTIFKFFPNIKLTHLTVHDINIDINLIHITHLHLKCNPPPYSSWSQFNPNYLNLAQLCPHLISFQISDAFFLDLQLINACTHLTTLHLSHITTITNINTLLTCPHLKTVKFKSCIIQSWFYLTISKCLALTTLHFIACKHHTDLNVIQLNCPHLYNYIISGPINISNAHHLRTHNYPTLHTISIIHNPNLINLNHLPTHNLHKLDLSGSSSLQHIHPLKTCTNLRTLILSKCSNLISIEGLEFCTKLSSLLLDHCSRITHLNPLTGCPNIKLLGLSSCLALNNIDGLRGCKLTGIDFRNCHILPTIKPLNMSHNLQYINLINCHQITDLTPLNNCSKMKYINIRGCINITNITTFSHFTSLRALDIQHCDSLKDIVILKTCTVLQYALVSNQNLEPFSSCINLLSIEIDGSPVDLTPLINCINLKIIKLNYHTDWVIPFELESYITFE